MDLFLKILAELQAQYPLVTSVFMVVGALRMVNKPLFSMLRLYVMSTPSTSDDEALNKVEQSKFYKGLSYVLDWFGSVKLPGAK